VGHFFLDHIHLHEEVYAEVDLAEGGVKPFVFQFYLSPGYEAQKSVSQDFLSMAWPLFFS